MDAGSKSFKVEDSRIRFKVGDRVQVRDDSEQFNRGEVVGVGPSGYLVLVDGANETYEDYYIKLGYQIGDRVEFRDMFGACSPVFGQWEAGTVVQRIDEDEGFKDLADGWDEAHTWDRIRRARFARHVACLLEEGHVDTDPSLEDQSIRDSTPSKQRYCSNFRRHLKGAHDEVEVGQEDENNDKEEEEEEKAEETKAYDEDEHDQEYEDNDKEEEEDEEEEEIRDANNLEL
eukprot:gnl/TRDRNA2_/TRDRNA2_168147_c0_seq1.p1 gnl/TRDRNA2_/TRDRNA2_168147_c0~~gnl/TRDRNA2_/TRDRNA2_168147_c0_seq1.p1  ORF type:complete len:251 (+),score=55.25 gnl/TRDRNA2_/TRDRNA2_168147_c0_seq1:62-754(+)